MSGGVPYLGSKISLVSKSEIRYEGILYTIDTKESTVALAKVRSYGTEGRPTDRPVAPRDEIYEYIIFRASDIKDLHVCEPPKPQPALSGGLPNDPAIVQHSPPISASYHIPYGQPSFGSLCSVPAFQHYPGQSFPHLSTFFPPSHSSAILKTGVRSATSIQPAYRKSPTSDAGVQVSGIATPEERSSKIDLNDQTSKNRQVNQTSAENGQKRSITINRRPQQQRMRGSQRRNRGRRQSSNRSQTPLQFDCEYDFEQANAEFIELENKLAKSKLDDSATEMPTEGENGEEVNAFYDREKSFFDNISCEASRRNNKEIARFDWRQERKLNVETFGVSRSDSWLRRRRGRGGFRGRGFRNRSTRGGSIQKSVTFENDKNEETVNAANELKNSEIPTIEIIVEKEKEWNEPADESKSEWK